MIGNQRDIVQWTIAMEAESEPIVGKLAVGYVIYNRARLWKQSLLRVCWTPNQFSCWNTLEYSIRRLELMGEKTLTEISNLITQIEQGCPDPSNGATHYLNIELTKQIRGGTLPSWVYKMEHLATIGKHDFYRDKK